MAIFLKKKNFVLLMTLKQQVLNQQVTAWKLIIIYVSLAGLPKMGDK